MTQYTKRIIILIKIGSDRYMGLLFARFAHCCPLVIKELSINTLKFITRYMHLIILCILKYYIYIYLLDLNSLNLYCFVQ